MNTTRFSRPFLFFLGACGLLLAAFVGWSILVFADPRIAEADEKISIACRDFAGENAEIRSFMVLATYSGGITANLLLAVGGAAWMWGHHRRRFAIGWLMIASVGALINQGLKFGYDRPRPPMEWHDPVAREDNQSYPSGHSMGSVIGYGMLGFVLVQRAKTTPGKLAIALALAAWVATIGFSRVFLRAHWLSDVIGGWLIGLAYVSACLALYFRRPRTPITLPIAEGG